MSDQPFKGIEQLDEHTRARILEETQQELDRVNAKTQNEVTQAKQQECSARIAEEIARSGPLTHGQRTEIINRWHRRFGLDEFGG